MDKAQKDEEILILSLAKPSLFGLLVDRHQRDFLKTANKIVHHKEEAEDIVQESFTKIYLHAKKFREMEGASFKSWAYKIVLNTSLSHYKKLKNTRENVKSINANIYNELPDPQAGNPEIEFDIKNFVAETLTRMPSRLNGVLQKYYLEDKSQKDIAREENVSLATIKMRIFRARKAFKKINNLSWTM